MFGVGAGFHWFGYEGGVAAVVVQYQDVFIASAWGNSESASEVGVNLASDVDGGGEDMMGAFIGTIRSGIQIVIVGGCRGWRWLF
jgi:peroxiredoxin